MHNFISANQITDWMLYIPMYLDNIVCHIPESRKS